MVAKRKRWLRRAIVATIFAPFHAVRAVFARPKESIPAALTGIMIVFAFVPYTIYPLAFFCLVPLISVATRVSPGRAFLWGWLSGALIICIGFYFIYTLFIVFGGLPWFAAFPIHVLFGLFQGAQLGLFALLVNLLSRDDRVPIGVSVPLAYVLVEFVCREIFIFPWYLGNATYPFLAFIQIADLFGGLGVTFVLCLTNAAIFLMARNLWRRCRGRHEGLPWRTTAVAAVVLTLTLVYGAVRIGQVDTIASEQPTIRIGLVEADLGIGLKGHTVLENLRIHQRYSMELEEQGAQLIVWPETAVNTYNYILSRRDTDDIEELRETSEIHSGILPRDVTYLAPSGRPLVDNFDEDRAAGASPVDWLALQRGFHTPLLFGVLTERQPNDLFPFPNPAATDLIWRWKTAGIPPHPSHGARLAYNSAFLIDEQGRVLGSYDKNVLLVFGEWVPLAGAVYRMTGFNFYETIPAAGDIYRGDGVRVLEMPFVTDEGEEIVIRIGGLVCYEDIIADYGLDLAELRPNMFINVINDGWFEESSAAYHHMAFSVLRAVEHRIPLVRSTNTGVSSFIDPVGRILSHTEVTEPETLLEDVPIMPPPDTVYSSVGDLLGWFSVVGVVACFVWRRRKGRSR